MKKYILSFALLLFLITQMQAQTSVYHPFPDSNAYWNQTDQYSYQSQNSVWCDGQEVYSLFIMGDTMLGLKNYHRLFSSGHDFSNYCGDYYWTNKYEGAIRQDKFQKELFIIQPGDSSERLLYNFNLGLGDTMIITGYSPSIIYFLSDTNIVSAIDSVLMGSNYRKRFWLNAIAQGHVDSNYVALIEGVGSTFGFIPAYLIPFTLSLKLNCFNQDGQTLYTDSTTSCELYTGVSELLAKNLLSLYPNPATTQLTIHTSSFHNEAVTVSIMNVLGQETSPPTPLHVERGDALIDVSKLSPGIYFLQLKSVSGSVMKKFVKE